MKKNFKLMGICLNMAVLAMVYLCLTGIIFISDVPVLLADTSVSTPKNSATVDTATKPLQNTTNTRVLQAEQWEFSRSGESILSIPVLNQVVNELLLDKSKKVEIQYPGGEEGELWVQQLTDWLVALGIPSRRMVTIPGSGADDIIKFEILK